jgi:oligogalacturonide transporter
VIFALAGSVSTVSSLVGVTFTVQLVAVGLAILLTLRLSPAATYRLAALSFAVGVALLIGMYLAGLKVTSPLFWLPVLFAGLGRGALNYIPWATYNYMADVDEIVTGKRRDGAFAGVMTFVRKLSQAIAVMIVGQVMEAAGFVAKASVQHPSAVAAITLLLSVGTLALLAFGIVVSLRFRLNPKTHAILVGEVERLRQDPAAEPSSQSAKDLVEDLSGWRFEQLWGRNSVARA